jgi:tetrahydromethanopterin S-methyltransferase subunit D
MVLTSIGVSVTHKLSKGTGYTIGTISFVVGSVIGALLAGLGGGR